MSRLFSTWRSSTRHSHAAHKHNLNHVGGGGWHAPDKSIRYVNRVFRPIPTFRTRSTNLAPLFQHPIPSYSPFANVLARAISTKPPASGLSSDAPATSSNQYDVEGWVDPEEMPSLRGTSMDDGSGNYSRSKNEEGTASPFPTDSEASVSADKQDLSTEEMVTQTTKKVQKQQFNDIEQDEQPVRDDDIASHSTQGGRRPRSSKRMMSGQSSDSGKINAGASHPASYGTNNPQTNNKTSTSRSQRSQPSASTLSTSSSTSTPPSSAALGHVDENESRMIEASIEGADHSSVSTAMTLEQEERMRQQLK